MKGGYLRVNLLGGRRPKSVTVHTLVLLAFVGPRPLKMDGCHNDGNPANNRLIKLRWDTRKNNHADKNTHGTMARGQKINTCKLTEEQVIEMRIERFNGANLAFLSEKYGITTTAVSWICLGYNWKHVGGPLVENKKKRTDTRITSASQRKSASLDFISTFLTRATHAAPPRGRSPARASTLRGRLDPAHSLQKWRIA